jgi:hypothetical protein
MAETIAGRVAARHGLLANTGRRGGVCRREVNMNLLPVCAVATLVAVLPVPSGVAAPLPSDPVGVFAVIDKVVLKPNAEQPTECELHGAFAVAEGRHGQYYRAPRWGVLRFGPGSKPDEAARQWRELQGKAGSGEVLAFSSRYEQFADGTNPLLVVGAADPAPALATYGSAMGLQKVSRDGYGPIRELSLLPRCEPAVAVGPAEDARWPAKPVTLTCRNCVGQTADLGYVFEVQTSDGERFASGAIAAGKDTTSWTTMLALQPGETVTWSVHVTGSKVERAPFDTATFTVAAEKAKQR